MTNKDFSAEEIEKIADEICNDYTIDKHNQLLGSALHDYSTWLESLMEMTEADSYEYATRRNDFVAAINTEVELKLEQRRKANSE